MPGIPVTRQCRVCMGLNRPAPPRSTCAAVRDSLWAALILYVVRLAGVWLGCWVGAEAGGTPPDVARRLWMGMVTQAGIALGLAQTVAARFPAWGPDYAGGEGREGGAPVREGPWRWELSADAVSWGGMGRGGWPTHRHRACLAAAARGRLLPLHAAA